MSNRNTHWGAGLLMLSAALLATAAGGCNSAEEDSGNVIQGINVPAKVDPSTAEFRFEYEMIPNAEMVREDTSPIWQLGRYAFRSGPDRLLVITRVTSVEEILSEEQKKQGVEPKRYDRFLERTWITIPAGTELGEELDLLKLQEQFLIGYDEHEGEGYFTQPNRVTGKVTLLEEGPASAVVKINMSVQPWRKPPWWVRETLAVPVTSTGIRASLALDNSGPAARRGGGDSKAEDQDTSSSQPAPAPPGMATHLAPGDAYDEQPSAEETQQRLVGRWEGSMRPIDPEDQKPMSKVYTYRFQFDDKGNYVFTTQRPGFPEFSRWGTWQMKEDYLVLHVQKYGVHVDHLQFLDSPFINLRVRWKNGRPVFQGDTGGFGVIDLHLTHGTFPLKDYLHELK